MQITGPQRTTIVAVPPASVDTPASEEHGPVLPNRNRFEVQASATDGPIRVTLESVVFMTTRLRSEAEE